LVKKMSRISWDNPIFILDPMKSQKHFLSNHDILQ
jgi:hypothetical protein